jgi:hypothetical protein
VNVNVNYGAYTYSPFIDTTRYPDISFSDDLSVRILNILTMLLIPSNIFFAIAMWAFSITYEYKKSNVKFVAIIASFLYYLNVVAIPIIPLYVIGQLNLITALAGIILSMGICTFISIYRYNNILQTRETAILRIEKQIDEAIARESTVENQRIVAEALLTVKKTLESLNIRSMSAYLALVSTAFIYTKLHAVTKNPSKAKYAALEKETQQARELLAQAYA